jgi:signal transduction histidine kinase
VGRGSGLGLGIARDVVTRFGGTIDLASAPGQGTTVTLEIPFGK